MARDFKAEMAAIWDNEEQTRLMRAAVHFLRNGEGSLVKMNGMDRNEVADKLERQWLPGPHREYREMLDASDLRDA